MADTTTAVAADYTKCVTFYGRLWIDYGTGATTTTDTTDKVYDF